MNKDKFELAKARKGLLSSTFFEGLKFLFVSLGIDGEK